MRRPEAQAGLGHPATRCCTYCQCDPEVRYHWAATVQQDVLGLNVAVNDILLVCVVQRVRDLHRDAHCFFDRELPLAIELLTQRLALDVRHHVVEERVRFTGIKQR
jgi:hypothetical protein